MAPARPIARKCCGSRSWGKFPTPGNLPRKISNPWKKRGAARPRREKQHAGGFTLIELLVVLALLAGLAAMLWPAFASARAAADQTRCAHQLRQLHAANVLYATTYGAYVAAAPDIWDPNLRRWHGVRTSIAEPFDPTRGPLWPFLGEERLRRCPAFHPLYTNGYLAFEAGCGGYGYNAYGVGSRSYWVGTARGAAQGMPPSAIRDPARTIMFADTAFPQSEGSARFLIEYSFAEPYRHLKDTVPEEAGVADPSIHFRHRGQANVVWCDGHVTGERRTLSKTGGGFESWNLGWFGGPNNDLFDPF